MTLSARSARSVFRRAYSRSIARFAYHRNHWSSKKRCKVIRKTKEGYVVLSEKGKRLGGPYKGKTAAVRRLKQVEYWKHMKSKERRNPSLLQSSPS